MPYKPVRGSRRPKPVVFPVGFTGIGVRAFGWESAVVTDSPEAATALRKYLAPWLMAVASGPARGTIYVCRRADGSCYDVRHGERLIASPTTCEAAVTVVQNLIDLAVVERMTGMVAIHAGTVGWGGKAILLPGPSHAGKSTLVAELLRRGCTYFSDEYAVLDRHGFVHPYPRAIMMRNGKPDATPVLASEFNAPTALEPSPVGLIVAVERTPGSAWQVRRVTQSEMVLLLLKNTPHVLDSEALLSPIARAAAGATCYEGVRDEAGEAAARILELT